MSTRSATIVRQRTYWSKDNPETDELLRFYRHCDGYPEGHGSDIADAIIESIEHPMYAHNWAQNFIARLFQKNACMEPEPKGSQHADLEYLYVVEGEKRMYFGRTEPKDIRDTITICLYSIGWDQSYNDAQNDNQLLFKGTAFDYKKWLEGAGR